MKTTGKPCNTVLTLTEVTRLYQHMTGPNGSTAIVLFGAMIDDNQVSFDFAESFTRDLEFEAGKERRALEAGREA